MSRREPRIFLVLSLLIAFLAGGLVISNLMVGNPLLAQAEPEVGTDAQDDGATRTQGRASAPEPVIWNPYAIADIAEAATPSVVMITVEWPATQRSPFPFDPWSFFFGWDPFFGPYTPNERSRVSGGSGFIFSSDGYIFTNQHVVGNPNGGQKITVRLHPESGIDLELGAEIVGADAQLDLAVLKLKDIPEQYVGKLPALPMGDSDHSRPGEWVIAIGNPYGYEQTVTVGSLSAKGREIQIYDQESGRVREYRDLLQTDAAINSGNSGGPLINVRGEVIGINTAVSTQAQGIGFAIPINTALAVVDELIDTGTVSRTVAAVEKIEWHRLTVNLVLGRADDDSSRPLLGVYQQPVTPEMAEELELPEVKGTLVVDVIPGSAAERAGIRPNDVIIRFGDVEITEDTSLPEIVSQKRPGQRVLVTVLRHEMVEVESEAQTISQIR